MRRGGFIPLEAGRALYHWRPVVLIVASGSYTLSKLHPAQLRFLFLLPNGLNGLSIPALQQPVLRLNVIAGRQKRLPIGVKIDMRTDHLGGLLRKNESQFLCRCIFRGCDARRKDILVKLFCQIQSCLLYTSDAADD